MKNRASIKPFPPLPPGEKIPAKSVLVLFDDKQTANSTIKRIAIVDEKTNTATVIDSLQEVGRIDVLGNPDGSGGTRWNPRERIGILNRLSIEKLLGGPGSAYPPVTDPPTVNAINKVLDAEKSMSGDIYAVEVYLIAKLYIERYPLLEGGV
jgi:hypothetical protein